jgi:hypothetical protein
MDLSQLFNDFLAATSFYAMLSTSAVDIAAAIYQAVREHNFQVKLLPTWLQTKVVYGILPVLAMYWASLGVVDPFRAALVTAASAGATAFVIANTYSIFKHFQIEPPKDHALDLEAAEAAIDDSPPSP